ncbi:MAG: Gfo/Idh/MocA family oxidoreductase [Ilumatobacteraceae bacterium]
MTEPLRMGLVGAGPWAHLFTGPMLASSDDVEFTGIWSRRPEPAQELAAHHGVRAVAELTDLFTACDAVTFSVPPSVQADLAAQAAHAGLAVLLDKPVGANVAEAEALAAAIDAAGVVSQVIFTNRYFDTTREFLKAASTFDAYGGRAAFFGNGSVPGTYFATPWRMSEGAVLDLGPHVLDSLDAAFGRIVRIEAHGDPLRIVLLECEHEGGAVSQAALCATTHQEGGLMVEMHGLAGRLALDLTALSEERKAAEFATAQRVILAEFAECVRTGTSHALDVHRGVYLQRLIDDATQQLAIGDRR